MMRRWNTYAKVHARKVVNFSSLTMKTNTLDKIYIPKEQDSLMTLIECLLNTSSTLLLGAAVGVATEKITKNDSDGLVH